MISLTGPFSRTKERPPCRYYVSLSNLTEQGRKTIKSRPERVRDVNKEITSMGGKIIAQYATLGPYDFVTVIEAESNEAVMSISVELGARGTDQHRDLARDRDRQVHLARVGAAESEALEADFERLAGHRLFGEAQAEVDQRAHARAAGPLEEDALHLVALIDAGDVQVHPGRVLDELLEEERGRDGACLAAADVLDVRDLAVELLLVIVEQRQLPDLLAGGIGGLPNPFEERRRRSSSRRTPPCRG